MSETLQNPVLEKDENGREILLKVKDLAVTFYNGKKEFKAVHDVNFNVYKGETFSLVGESGSGKQRLVVQSFVSILLLMVISISWARRSMERFLMKISVGSSEICRWYSRIQLHP